MGNGGGSRGGWDANRTAAQIGEGVEGRRKAHI